MRNLKQLVVLFSCVLVITGCGKNPNDNSFNVFSVEDDKQLGAEFHAEILNTPQEYPILSKSSFPESYSYVEGIINKILNSGNVFYKDEFVWEVFIIHDDNILNAFVTPGGYIYVYTGLIKFLDTEHALAGVLGHEIAHADRRHTTDQLTKAYGASFIFDVVFGSGADKEAQLADIAANLAFLAYGRGKEAEADEFSVEYLCPTSYKADGAAVFFQKLEEGGQTGGTPEFLSTHPNPGDRVKDIKAKANELNCAGTSTNDQAYSDFKQSLP